MFPVVDWVTQEIDSRGNTWIQEAYGQPLRGLRKQNWTKGDTGSWGCSRGQLIPPGAKKLAWPLTDIPNWNKGPWPLCFHRSQWCGPSPGGHNLGLQLSLVKGGSWGGWMVSLNRHLQKLEQENLSLETRAVYHGFHCFILEYSWLQEMCYAYLLF
jgi:hypothetical protein